MIKLIHGDCLEEMKSIPDGSVDLCLTDPPYGTTACKWDTVIPFEPMWVEIKRIVKPNGAICLFGSEPFSSALRMSNIKMFKYDWVWKKSKPSGVLLAKRRPLKAHELISVFSKSAATNSPRSVMNYFPQGLREINKTIKNKKTNRSAGGFDRPCFSDSYVQTKTGYPLDWLDFKSESKTLHPTQKPVPLLEYLIKTYALEGETVLDFTMGSGSTGVAAKNLGRKFIGIEKDEKYFEIAKNRINLS